MSNSSFKLSALAIACGLALSACSSGGGGDAPSVKPTPTVPGASNPAPGQGGNVETPSSGQNGSSVPPPPPQGLAVVQEANRRHLPITTIMKEVRQVAIQPNHLQPIKLMMQQKQNLKNHGVKVQRAMIIPPSKSTLKMTS